jgi:hypothetical protein
MTKPTYKELVTEAVLKQLPEGGMEMSPSDAMKKWWMNFRREGGLRLSELGDLSFRLAEIEFYQYEFDAKDLVAGKTFHIVMMELDKKIQCPYYIGIDKSDKKKNKPFIRFYDSKIAMMVSLYGTVAEYLNNIKLRK